MNPLILCHRFAQRCSPYVVSAFIYIWHPESIDSFDRYLSSPSSSVPRFSNSRDSFGVDWTTSITLHHWKIAPNPFPEELVDVFNEEKESGHIPPMKPLLDGSSKPLPTESLKKLEERSSSIIMSGDHAGNYWTCTILSSSITDQGINDYILEVAEIMNCFIHRQSIARLLCFLCILGMICWDHGREYDEIIEHMQSIIGLSVGGTVLLTVCQTDFGIEQSSF
jgi:hypothetical protein